MTGLVVRPARRDELGTLRDLARLSGPGFTSLPEDDALLDARLAKSVDAFAASPDAPGEEAYLLMLEDAASGAVLGCAGVKAAVGLKKPFFNYKVFTVAQASAEADRRFDMDVMLLVNEFTGCSEVGSLFVRPEGRGGGAGRLLAQARYLLMAADPSRFSGAVIAELRGDVGPDGQSAFWEDIGARFFRMTFNEADHLSAVSENQFILDLMPKYPIYIDLLSPRAREVIGKTHPDGAGARALLEWEGFRYDRVVDIFDGGPLVSAPRADIRTIRESRTGAARFGVPDNAVPALVSSDRFPEFRVTRADVAVAGDEMTVPPAVADVLQIEEGDAVRVWTRHD